MWLIIATLAAIGLVYLAVLVVCLIQRTVDNASARRWQQMLNDWVR